MIANSNIEAITQRHQVVVTCHISMTVLSSIGIITSKVRYICCK